MAKNCVKLYPHPAIFNLKMHCYKGLGYSFKKINLYRMSKHYLAKYLQFTLVTNDTEQELKGIYINFKIYFNKSSV